LGAALTRTISDYRYPIIIIAIMAFSAITLFVMGRLPWCECGYIKFWHGEVLSSENSQHISDWYSLSHIVHGFLFYGALKIVMGSSPIGLRAVIATIIEEAWEILENTNFIIDRYREATFSLHYYGDSIVNSVGDVVFMLIGFMLASRLPIWATIGLAIGLEVLAAIVIRDNLTLNVIMLVYPLEFIKTWQLGA
jgi:hypothetical protein